MIENKNSDLTPFYKIIAALGDSVTNGYWDDEGIGWFGRLSKKLLKKYPRQLGFNNISQDADRIYDMYHRLGAECMTREIDILLIFCGQNDLVRSPDINTPTDLSEHLRLEYWHRVLPLAKKHIGTVIVMEMIPQKNSEQASYGWFDAPCYTLEKDIIEYNKKIAEICKQYDVPVIKQFDLWNTPEAKKLYADNEHPNSEGHEFIADTVFDALEKMKVF